MGKKHTDTVQRMLDMIAANPGIRTPALADAFEISPNEVRGRLQTAIEAGLVVVCLVKQAQGHPQNEFRISASAPCAEGKAPDWAAYKAARRQTRLASDTPAGGGDITPAAVDRALPCDHLREATAVAAPPKPDVPVEASADVRFPYYGIFKNDGQGGDVFQRVKIPVSGGRIEFDARIRNYDDSADTEDDTDEHAFQRARRLVCSANTDGQVTIARRGCTGLVLTAEEAIELRSFLSDAGALLERVAA